MMMIIITLAIMCIVGSAALLIRENIPPNVEFDKINKSSIAGNRTQGNYLLLSKNNGIATFPFVWADGLYLYSIDENKNYLLRTSLIPLMSFDNFYTLQNSRAYYTKGMANPGYKIFMHDFHSLARDKVVLKSVNSYAVTDKHLYFSYMDWGVGDNGEDYGEILKKDMSSGDEWILEKGNISSYLSADDEYLYYYNIDKKTIFQLSLDSEQITEYNNIENEPVWIGTGSKNNIIIVNVLSEVIDYNTKTFHQQVVTKIDEKYSENHHLKNDFLYCDSYGTELCRVNLLDGTQDILISLGSVDEVTSLVERVRKDGRYYDMVSNYCKDYIAIEASYSFENKIFDRWVRKLLIFDYDGNFVRSKKL